MKRAGILWIFRAVGLVIVLVGVYMAGGEDLTCVSVSPASAGVAERTTADSRVAECRLQTRRWLGKSLVGNSRYGGITKAETIVVRPTGEGAEDAWYVGLLAGDKEIGRVFARREQVQAARDRLRAWFEGGLRGSVRIEWSTWPFGGAAMGFALVWLLVLSAISRADRGAGR